MLMMPQLVGSLLLFEIGLICFFNITLPMDIFQIQICKSYIVVEPSSVASAEQIFWPLGVQVVTSHRFIGWILGDVPAKLSFVQEKVKQWATDVQHLSQLAISQPQAAYVALTKSLQCEWIYMYNVLFPTAVLPLLHWKALSTPHFCHHCLVVKFLH